MVDVLISGAGPIGFLTAYCLTRYGISTNVAEQPFKLSQPTYGRAAMIVSCSLALPEQLDLAGRLRADWICGQKVTHFQG